MSISQISLKLSSSQMLLVGSRRWLFFTLLTAFALFLLYKIPGGFGSSQTAFPDTPPIYNPPPKPKDGRFRWPDRVAQFPPEIFRTLPTTPLQYSTRVQHKSGKIIEAHKVINRERQGEVQATLKRCWTSYKDHEWMKDELSPLSGGGRNSVGGWAASLVDALDTLHIMGMTTDFDDAVKAAASVDSSTCTDEPVNIFETTIRYLGGYLAAYNLSGRPILLDKAVEVGEMLLIAFDTPNHVPITGWNWRSAQEGHSQIAPDGILVSDLGSLSLEGHEPWPRSTIALPRRNTEPMHVTAARRSVFGTSSVLANSSASWRSERRKS